ncbi:hypothetical protein QFC22_000804 [Naganishia vaughanmartiniae]|uniref:Uncharacterized protein n=1 Tax=Naganishia vaughanmartiniae TaxID=1424756 RepID=A0ACC2XJ71_9TREE|nr:hypothetical protein QFC22_000804 [Naganishia vaughanmartiniae]
MPRMFIASERRRQGAYHVLLLSTGSVASIKIPLIVQALHADPEQRFEVQVAATNTSLTFYDGKSVEEVSNGKSQVWTDQDEWGVGLGSMNTFMYTHPITAKHLKVVIEELGYKVIGPQGSKGLACGDIG